MKCPLCDLPQHSESQAHFFKKSDGVRSEMIGGEVRRGIQQIVCLGCGEKFDAVRSTARFCSPTCRKRASRLRRGE